jgi:hypothetical protein
VLIALYRRYFFTPFEVEAVPVADGQLQDNDQLISGVVYRQLEKLR